MNIEEQLAESEAQVEKDVEIVILDNLVEEADRSTKQREIVHSALQEALASYEALKGTNGKDS